MAPVRCIACGARIAEPSRRPPGLATAAGARLRCRHIRWRRRQGFIWASVSPPWLIYL